MSERGVFAVSRGIWDHPFFDSEDPFTKREAWIWLLSEASWRDRQRKIKGRFYTLHRGELAASRRHIARCWRWSEGSVRRFLDALVLGTGDGPMIGLQSDSGISVITICNYSVHQIFGGKFGPASGPATSPPPAQQRPNTENIESIEGGAVVVSAPRGKSLIAPEAFEIATEVVAAMGLHPADPLSVGAPMKVQAWLNEGLHRDHILFGVRRTMARRPGDPPSSLNYFTKAIARAKADLTPTAGVDDGQAANQPSLRLLRPIKGGGGFASIAARLRARDGTGG